MTVHKSSSLLCFSNSKADIRFVEEHFYLEADIFSLKNSNMDDNICSFFLLMSENFLYFFNILIIIFLIFCEFGYEIF